MSDCSRSANDKLLIGAFLFAVSFALFLWLQYEPPTNSGHPETPVTDDATLAADLAQPEQQGEPATAKSDTEPGPDHDIPRTSTILQTIMTDANRGSDGSWLAAIPAGARTKIDGALFDEPQGNLTISGRVLTRSGSPVAGIQVTAKAIHLFEHGQRKAIRPGTGQRQTTTGYDGAYAFEYLVNGEYQLSTSATDRYTRALIHVRAGVDFADLIVTSHRDVRVQGKVTTGTGEPLAGVQVQPMIAGAETVTTNRDGRYVVDVTLPRTTTSVMMQAVRAGYQDQELRLAIGHSEQSILLESNIVMTADEDTGLVIVSGAVTGPERQPAFGQRILLSSATMRKKYRSITDANGAFELRGVEPGDDYLVSVNATENYEDYFQQDIEISDDDLFLDIELAIRETGVLRGQLVNLYDNAVSNFSLILGTRARSYYNQQVVSDAAGQFVVEKAPAGELLLKTKSSPYYTVEGIRLEPDAESQVTVVLDWGYDEIQGRVVNDHGNPIAVPSVILTWVYERNSLRTTARRNTAADEQGYFRFTQLGPGSHRLIVNAAGYKPVSLNHDVAMQGSNLVVELAPK